jgi:endonuclease YncB( thermonuclease family)
VRLFESLRSYSLKCLKGVRILFDRLLLFLIIITPDDAIAQRLYVIDGDTFVLTSPGHASQSIRLWGIDAPDQPALARSAARRQLIELIGNEIPKCSQPPPLFASKCHKNTISYNRLVRVCSTSATLDLSRALVASGYAVDWPVYSCGQYRSVADMAQKQQLGLWRLDAYSMRVLSRQRQ